MQSPGTQSRIQICIGALLVFAACSNTTVGRRSGLIAGSTDLIDFGDVVIDSPAPKKILTFLNKGDRDVTLSNAQGDNLGGIFQVTIDHSTINPQGDAVVSITFQPSGNRDYATTITFPNDSENESTFTLALKGRGITGDPCGGVICNDPPAAVCSDTQTSRSFNPAGACDRGRCNYVPIDTKCPNGCNNTSGFCAGDICAGKSCNTPPGAVCLNGNSHQYTSSGTCTAGSCVYGATDVACPNGCNNANGLCNGDPCTGVVCNYPPNACYKGVGTCNGGTCTYLLNDGVSCNDNDPCTDNDACTGGSCHGTAKACGAQAPVCVNQDTLRVFSGGQCGSGICSTPYNDQYCSLGCQNGACITCPNNCITGDDCTRGQCQRYYGCIYDASQNDGNRCVASSADCREGQCNGGQCLSVEGARCQARVHSGFCTDVRPGYCDSSGRCTPDTQGSQFACTYTRCPSGFCINICDGIEVCSDWF